MDRKRKKKKKMKKKMKTSIVFPVFEDDESIKCLAKRLNETKDAKRQSELLIESMKDDQIMTKERLRWYVEAYTVGNKEIRNVLKREIFSRRVDLKFACRHATSIRTLNTCLDFSTSLPSSCILQVLLSLSSTFDLNAYKIINRVVPEVKLSLIHI